MMVRIACDEGDMGLLSKMGIPLSNSTQSRPVELLDETDHYFIVIAEDRGAEIAIKVSKDVVKAVRHEEYGTQSNHD